MVAERLLQVRQLLAVGQAFHRGDVAAVGLHAEHQAGPGRRAVDQHRARSADAVLTAQVGAGVAEVVPEHVGERPARLYGHRVLAVVDPQPDGVAVGHGAPVLASPVLVSAACRSVGSTGIWSKLTAVPDSASLIAFSTAAGAPIVPPSPMPFAPVSLKADGVSRCTISIGHSSAAVGAR